MEIDVINNLIAYGPAGILFGVSLVLLILASRNAKKNGNSKTHSPPCIDLLQCKQELTHSIDKLDSKIDRIDDKVDILLTKASI